MIVHLIRHGQSYNTHRPPGEPYPANPPLTEVGVGQAERVAARMAGLGIDRLVASPMLRAVETADHVSRATGLPVEVLFACHEHRVAEGYTCWGARELRARYPGLLLPQDLHDEGWRYGEEPMEKAVGRADQVLAWVREQAALAKWRQVAVVTHGAITRIIVARLLGVDPATLRPVVFHHTSLTTLRLVPPEPDAADEDAPGVIELLAINDTAHLAGQAELDPLAGVSR